MTVTGHGPAGGNLKKVLALVIFAGLLMTGCGSKSAQTAATPSASETAGLVSGVTVPDIVGKRLDNATEELKGLGLKVEATDTAAGKSIFVESNWQVTTQDVSPGATVAKSSRISLGVVHLTDATPTPTPTPTAAPVVAPPAAVVAPPVVVPVPAAPRAVPVVPAAPAVPAAPRAVPVAPAAPAAAPFANCTAARAAGAAPVYRGTPGYGKHLDRDGDGIGCDK